MEEIVEKTEDVSEELIEKERVQFEKMTKTPMAKLILWLGIPTMLNMMVTSGLETRRRVRSGWCFP